MIDEVIDGLLQRFGGERVRSEAEGQNESEQKTQGRSHVVKKIRESRSRGAPGVTRTPGLRIRNPLLYPAELRAQIE